MELSRVIEVTRAACHYGGPGPLSMGEALTAALVLNRADWLGELGYTIAAALDRIDADTIPNLRDAESTIADEIESGALELPAARSEQA